MIKIQKMYKNALQFKIIDFYEIYYKIIIQIN